MVAGPLRALLRAAGGGAARERPGPLPPARRELARLGARHAVVEASAGTGKTYILEHLVVDLLLRRDASLDQILVVTFTEKATAELGERVRRKLEELLALRADEPGQPPALDGQRLLADRRAGAAQAAARRCCGFDRGQHLHHPRLLPAAAGRARLLQPPPVRRGERSTRSEAFKRGVRRDPCATTWSPTPALARLLGAWLGTGAGLSGCSGRCSAPSRGTVLPLPAPGRGAAPAWPWTSRPWSPPRRPRRRGRRLPEGGAQAAEGARPARAKSVAQQAGRPAGDAAAQLPGGRRRPRRCWRRSTGSTASATGRWRRCAAQLAARAGDPEHGSGRPAFCGFARAGRAPAGRGGGAAPSAGGGAAGEPQARGGAVRLPGHAGPGRRAAWPARARGAQALLASPARALPPRAHRRVPGHRRGAVGDLPPHLLRERPTGTSSR